MLSKYQEKHHEFRAKENLQKRYKSSEWYITADWLPSHPVENLIGSELKVDCQ